ncbi:MAG: hypothetical protein NC098_00265 [Lachnoclostridium sp.]|nr:hypothetical protein [Lachnoclostridium sp.]
MKTLIYNLLALMTVVIGCVSCIEDSVATSPSVQPVFSVDTLKMGLNFTEQGTPTQSFVVYNRHDKILNIDNISLRSGDRTFRINVDGFSGTSFSNVEIRPNDSIYVFVEATLPELNTPAATDIEDFIDFTTRGITRSLVVTATGRDALRHRATVITSDVTWDATLPHIIYDSLVVAHGATLTLAPGTELYFHDAARMDIRGCLISNGTAENPVNLTGDRIDNVVGNISFDLMASQWKGLTFMPESRGNYLSHTIVRNTVSGVLVDSLAQADFVNCRLRNSAGRSLTTWHAEVTLAGCEIAEASAGLALFHGGKVRADHCTFANYYLFSVLSGPALGFSHADDDTDDLSGLPRLSALITNSIIYGNGQDLSHGDLTGMDVTLNRCILKSEGEDDDNFISCLWDTDPLYYTVRSEYLFDYRVKPESPAIDADDPALLLPATALDFYGVTRTGTIGAYEFVAPEEKE